MQRWEVKAITRNSKAPRLASVETIPTPTAEGAKGGGGATRAQQELGRGTSDGSCHRRREWGETSPISELLAMRSMDPVENQRARNPGSTVPSGRTLGQQSMQRTAENESGGGGRHQGRTSLAGRTGERKECRGNVVPTAPAESVCAACAA